jgi:hypothetical protein
MHIAKEEVEVKLQIPGATARLQTDFGDVAGYGRMSAEYFSLAAGVDTTQLFVGLQGNACQCPHWGYILKGRITTTSGDSERETVQTGDLFYWPPGHNLLVEEDADFVMFSPQHEHLHVIDHMKAKVGA